MKANRAYINRNLLKSLYTFKEEKEQKELRKKADVAVKYETVKTHTDAVRRIRRIVWRRMYKRLGRWMLDKFNNKTTLIELLEFEVRMNIEPDMVARARAV